MAVKTRAEQQTPIPDGWSETRLGDIISLRGGLSYKGELISDTGNSLVTMGCVSSSDRFNFAGLRRYRGEYRDVHVLRPGDMVIATRDVTQNRKLLGSPAIVPEGLPGEVAIAATNLYKVTNSSKTPTDFLYWLMKTPNYRNQIIASAKGTTIVMLTKDSVEDFRFALPPLAEQRAIVAVLGVLDDKIELNRRMNSTLEAMARALFQSWFVDFDPVCAKLEGGTPVGLDEPTAALFPGNLEETALGQTPQGWEVRSLDKIAHYLNGLALQKYPPDDRPTLPVIKIAQLRRGDSVGADRCNTDLPAAYIVQDGDVLFSWSGSLEVELWCGGRGALNQHLFKVTSPQFPKWFYYLWTRHHLEDFRRTAASKATTMGHIQRQHLTDAKVLVPPPVLITAMTRLVAPLIDRVIANNVQSRTLQAVRHTLLPKLLSGQLRIPEANWKREEDE